jgi:hypothetical protein
MQNLLVRQKPDFSKKVGFLAARLITLMNQIEKKVDITVYLYILSVICSCQP